jgi:hypothetical protein
MLFQGKEIPVETINKNSYQIQQRMDQADQMPQDSKAEITKKEYKELKDQSGEGFGFGTSGWGNGQDTLFGNNNTFSQDGELNSENRAQYYNLFMEMSQTNFIHRALSIVSDDASQKNSEGNVVKSYSDDDDIKTILEELFNKRLNLNKELWSIFYETIRLGDNFYEVIPDSYENPKMIVKIRHLNPFKVNRIEKNGRLAFYTYNTSEEMNGDNIRSTSDVLGKSKDETIYRLQPWQIIHFKITDKDFDPYGGSLLKAGVRSYRRLTMLEDAILVYRLARVPERRVFKIDVGNKSTDEANRFVQKMRNDYRTQQVMDGDGKLNRKAAPLSITQDIFIPVREGQNGTDITTLSGGQGLNSIDDLRYFKEQILLTLNIPISYLGVGGNEQGGGGEAGRGSLAIQDIKFARYIERIQYYIEEGLTKLAYIELFFHKKKKDELQNFKLELTPPSNVKEIMDLEYQNQKMGLIGTMQGLNIFPMQYILKDVLNLSKKEINDIVFYKQQELAANPNQGMDMGMGGGAGMGMMGMDSGLDAMGGGGGFSPPPPMDNSIGGNETLVQDQMINLFGKEVLIENKDDFLKVVKLADEWKRVEREKGKLDSKRRSSLLEEIKKAYNPQKLKKNNYSYMFFDGELGGISFGEETFNLWKKPSKNSKDVLYEETTKDL